MYWPMPKREDETLFFNNLLKYTERYLLKTNILIFKVLSLQTRIFRIKNVMCSFAAFALTDPYMCFFRRMLSRNYSQ
jgi:hypothetical protein